MTKILDYRDFEYEEVDETKPPPSKFQGGRWVPPTRDYPGLDPKAQRHLFLEYVVKKHGWTKGAELGVWKGVTFLHLLNAFPELTMIGVDAWQPQPNNPFAGVNGWSHEQHEARVRKQAQKFGDRAIIHKMWTTKAAPLVEDNSLDFIFIDADHGTQGVLNDIRAWAPKIKEDGIIFGHDINWITVKRAVEQAFVDYEVGTQNVWWAPKKDLK